MITTCLIIFGVGGKSSALGFDNNYRDCLGEVLFQSLGKVRKTFNGLREGGGKA